MRINDKRNMIITFVVFLGACLLEKKTRILLKIGSVSIKRDLNDAEFKGKLCDVV